MADKVIKIRGEFDASGILASFKKIRDDAAKSGVGDKILAGYDKELAKVEKLTTQIIAQSNKGLTNPNDIKEYTRTVNQLEKAYGILNVKAQDFADANNYSKENAEVKKYANQLQNLIQKQEGLKKAAEDYIDANKNSLKISEKEANQLKKSIADAQAYKKVVDDIVETKMKAAQQKAAPLILQTQGGQQKIEEISNQQKNFGFSVAARKGPDKNKEALVGKDGAVKEAEALAAAQAEYNRILRETIQTGGSADDAMKDFTKSMKGYKLEVTNADEIQEEFRKDIEETTQAALANRQGLSRGDNQKLINAGKEMAGAQALQNTVNSAPIAAVQQNSQEQVQTQESINKALEQRIAELEEIIRLQQKDAEAANQASGQVVDDYRKQAEEAQKNVDIQKSIEDGFDRISRGAKQILSVTTSWRALRNVVRSTFNDIKDLDKAFGSIAMVTSYSVKDMWSQYDQYAAMANKLGQSTKSVVEASALYYQQGLKTNQVMQLTEETMKLATLAGLDFKDATSQMTAALRAFHMDMDQGAHVTDVYAEVAAHAAVDVQGLSEAMSACAAIANSSGMAFETTTAMLATMVEATQEAPKNLGTAMKTILARFTELKTNVAGTADSEFDDLDYNKVDKALKSVGISIKDATGQFRNMDDVLLELSGKWSGLSRNSQRYIATIAAGSRQQSRFIALMENYERTMELVDVAQNSAGRSSKQFAKYQDTVEYRLNKISNTWEQFRTNLLDSDFYKGLLDNFNGVLNKLNNTSASQLIMLGATWLTVGRKAITNAIEGWSKGAEAGVNKITGLLGKIDGGNLERGKANITKKYQEEHGAVLDDNQKAELNKQLSDYEKSFKNKGKIIGTSIATAVTSAITSGIIQDDPISAGLTATYSTAIAIVPSMFSLGKTLGTALGSGIKGALAATGIGLAITATAGAIASIISAFRATKTLQQGRTLEGQLKTAKKLLETSKQNLEQKQNDVKETQTQIKNLEEIQKQYNKLSNKITLTQEEQEEYNNLVDDIKTNYPSLISYYDQETNKIQLNNKLLDQRVKTLNTLQEQQQKALIEEEEYNTILKNKTDTLQLKQDYQNKILSQSSNLSDEDQEKIKQYFTNYDGSDETIKAIENLIKANEKNNEIQSNILMTLSDFESAYRQKNKLSEEETYAKILADIQKLNPNFSSAEAQAAASKVYQELKSRDEYESGNNLKKEDFVRGFKLNDWKNLLGIVGVAWNYSERNSLKDWDDLPDQLRKILIDYGIDTEQKYKDYTSSLGKDTEKIIEDLENKAYSKYVATLKEDAAKGTYTKETQQIEALQKDRGNLSANVYLKRINQLRGQGISKETLKSAFNYQDIEEFRTNLQTVGIDAEKVLSKISVNAATTQKNILSNLISKNAFNSEEIATGYAKVIDYIKSSGISNDIQNVLFNFDYSDITATSASELIDSLSEQIQGTDPTIGSDLAKKIAQGYVDQLQKENLADFTFSTVLDADQAAQAIADKGKTIATAYKDVLSEVSNAVKSGGIDIFKKEELEKNIKTMGLDPSDFIYQQTDGRFGVYYEDLQKAASAQFQSEEAITKQLDEQLQNSIDQLKLEISTLETLKNEGTVEDKNLTIQEKITKELAKQKSLTANKHITKITSNLGIDLSEHKISDEESKLLEEEIKKKKEDLAKLEQKQLDPNRWKTEIEAYKAYQAAVESGNEELAEEIKEQKKALGDANKAVTDAKESRDKAYKSWQKSIEDVTKKQKELNEAIKGSEFWDSGLDSMYNYTTALDTLSDKVEDAQKKMQNAVTLEEGRQAAQDYINSLAEKMATLKAEAQVYQKRIDDDNKNWKTRLEQKIKSLPNSNQMKYNLDDYLTKDKNGNTQINVSALQKAKLPDNIKKLIIDEGKALNDNQKKLREILKQQEAIEEEFKQKRKEALQSYVDLEQKMADTLKEKYQKEIDDLKNKYSSMEEADNNYLDSLQKAIDKQRKLRDEENSWNDLANKERKLSLMRRDTSRGNAVEVKSLEKDVQKDREQLLDNAVDNIVDSLKEMYDLQKESRDAEIEYRESLLEDAQILKEVTEALKNIKDEEGLVQWFKDNTVGLKDMTDAQIQLEMENWKELFGAKSTYTNLSKDEFENALLEQGQYVQDIVDTTSETLTTEANRVMDQVTEQTKEAIKAAKDALDAAKETEREQYKAWQEAITAADKAKEAFDKVKKDVEEFLQRAYNDQTTDLHVIQDKNGNKEYYDSEAEAERIIKSRAQAGNNSWTYQGTEAFTKTGKAYLAQHYQYFPTQNTNLTMEDGWGNKQLGYKLIQVKTNKYNHGLIYEDATAKVPRTTTHGILHKNNNGEWEFVQSSNSAEDADLQANYWGTDVNGGYSESERRKYYAFAKGGLVDYTGPAWVDGSRSNPEAFLSSEDTRRIGEAARILADLPILSQPVNKDTITNNTVGDTNIQIEVNVDQIASDYDVDDAVKRVEEQIVKAAKYAGSNVILTKR